MTRPARWQVTGGDVRSATDGQRHYVSAGQVARLHRLADHEWERWVYDRDTPDEVLLGPRNDGNYRDLRGQRPPDAPAPGDCFGGGVGCGLPGCRPCAADAPAP